MDEIASKNAIYSPHELLEALLTRAYQDVEVFHRGVNYRMTVCRFNLSKLSSSNQLNYSKLLRSFLVWVKPSEDIALQTFLVAWLKKFCRARFRKTQEGQFFENAESMPVNIEDNCVAYALAILAHSKKIWGLQVQFELALGEFFLKRSLTYIPLVDGKDGQLVIPRSSENVRVENIAISESKASVAFMEQVVADIVDESVETRPLLTYLNDYCGVTDKYEIAGIMQDLNMFSLQPTVDALLSVRQIVLSGNGPKYGLVSTMGFKHLFGISDALFPPHFTMSKVEVSKICLGCYVYCNTEHAAKCGAPDVCELYQTRGSSGFDRLILVSNGGTVNAAVVRVSEQQVKVYYNGDFRNRMVYLDFPLGGSLEGLVDRELSKLYPPNRSFCFFIPEYSNYYVPRVTPLDGGAEGGRVSQSVKSEPKLSRKKLECPICFETPNVTFACGHVFCSKCAMDKRVVVCPTCRAPVTMRIPLFL